MCGYGTRGHGLMLKMVMAGKWTVGFDDLKGFSKINNSVILCNKMHHILNAVEEDLTCQFFKTTVFSVFQ